MDSLSVYRLLSRKGLKRQDLNCRTKKEHRDRIAIKLGTDWKRCAEALGLSEEDVDAISREHKWSRNRRLAMVDKWDGDYGAEATYLRLAQALAAAERDDLVLYLIDVFIVEQGFLFRKLGSLSFTLKRSCWTGCGLLAFFVLLGGISAYVWSLVNVDPVEILPPSIKKTDLPTVLDHSHTMNGRGLPSSQMNLTDMLDEELHMKKRSKCEHFSYGLPKYYDEFVGREDIVEEIAAKILSNSMPLFNINGPMGCGKSRLAVQLGHRLLQEERLSVSYIDVSDRKFDQFVDNVKDPEIERLPRLKPVTVIEYPTSIRNFTFIHDVVLAKELSNWSKSVTCRSVLILDNCDSIKDISTFVRFLRSLIVASNRRLKIVVTSRDRLEHFESSTISELSMDDAINLLKSVVPSIDKGQSEKLLALLGGCPLTLKVAGNLLEQTPQHVDTIVNEIENRQLNRLSSQRMQFVHLVSIVYEYLPPSLRPCGHYFHLFPGSFDKVSGQNIMTALKCEDAIEEFVERSLLDDYEYGGENRIKMPALVEEYFKEYNQSRGNGRSNIFDKKEFKKKFSAYYVDLIALDIMYPFKLWSPDEYNWKFSVDSHNIHLLTTIIFTHRVPNAAAMHPEELTALVPLTLQGWIPFHRVLNHYNLYRQFMIELRPVCKFLPGSRCTNFYAQLISDIYHLECHDPKMTFTELIEMMYYGNKYCGAIYDGVRISYLHMWNRLGPVIQSFVLTARLMSPWYVAWVIKGVGIVAVPSAFLKEYLSMRERGDDRRLSYLFFVVAFPTVSFVIGMLLVYYTVNSDLAIILHVYMPSTLLMFLLFLFSFLRSVSWLALSYVFRIWTLLLFSVIGVRLICWILSVVSVLLTTSVLV